MRRRRQGRLARLEISRSHPPLERAECVECSGVLEHGTGSESGMKRGVLVTGIHSWLRYGCWSNQQGEGVVIVIGVVESVDDE